MNKFLIIVMLLVCSFSVYAYNTDNIKEYFAFEDTGFDNITSDVNQFTNSNTLYSSIAGYGYSHITGIRGNALKVTKFVNSSTPFNQNISNGYDISFLNQYSINFWIYNATQTGTENYFRVSNGTNLFTLEFEAPDTLHLSNATGSELLYIYVNDTWSMITLVYNSSNFSVYVNGFLQSSQVGTNFFPNSKNLSIGSIGYYSFDEFSVWNTPLSELDIAQLYNYGVGLNYSETLSGNTVPNPVCIDSSSICNEPVYIGGNLVCAYANTTYCSNGCINDVCYNSVINECNVIGSKICEDSTTIATCSDSNGDTALDYDSLTSCAIGELCVQSFNFASCNNVTSSGIHNLYAWTFMPYSTSNLTDGVSYSIDTVQRTLNVITNNSLHTQKFYDGMGVNYISRVCDYVETEVYNNLASVNTNITYPFLLTSPISSKSVLRFSITPDLISNGTIIISDLSGTQDTTFYYNRNATNKQMTIYLSNGSILYDDYDVGSSDSLTSVDFEITYDFISDYYSTRMKFNRAIDNTVIKDILAIIGTDIFNITFIPTLNNVTINYVQLYTIPTSSVWTGTEQPLTFLENCVYDKSGVYKVRTYGSDYAVPDYESYLDYVISIGLTDSATGISESDFLKGQGLTTESKYVIVLMTILVIMIVGIGIGFTANFLSGSIVISSVISAFVFIIFVVMKWVPAWSIAVLVVVAVAVTIIMGMLGNSNSGGSG